MIKKYLAVIVCLFVLAGACWAKPRAVQIFVNGAITPSTKSFIEKSLLSAEASKANVFIIQLNTPGGLLESTREIVQKILGSKVPVVVYVAPQGSRAGSAGVFITLAANIAAMAPGTNIGAAHPVGLGGQSDSSVMFHKITNDASAFIRSIAEKRHRNPVWAELSVRESISSTETEALKDSVIDYIAPSVESLLNIIHGREVETAAGKVRLETANAAIETIETSWIDEFLKLITDPNIAYILMMLGIFGILFEFYNPGAIFPGIIGAVSIILAAYSFQMMPINYAGLALIIVAIILFLLEIKIISHGILTIGGVVSLLLGSMMLINSSEQFKSISMSVIITVVVVTTLFFAFILGLGIKAQSREHSSGKETFNEQTGIALTDIMPGKEGDVKVLGEIWKAVSKQEIKAGQKIKVENTESLTLFVKPL